MLYGTVQPPGLFENHHRQHVIFMSENRSGIPLPSEPLLELQFPRRQTQRRFASWKYIGWCPQVQNLWRKWKRQDCTRGEGVRSWFSHDKTIGNPSPEAGIDLWGCPRLELGHLGGLDLYTFTLHPYPPGIGCQLLSGRGPWPWARWLFSAQVERRVTNWEGTPGNSAFQQRSSLVLREIWVAQHKVCTSRYRTALIWPKLSGLCSSPVSLCQCFPSLHSSISHLLMTYYATGTLMRARHFFNFLLFQKICSYAERAQAIEWEEKMSFGIEK